MPELDRFIRLARLVWYALVVLISLAGLVGGLLSLGDAVR